ncbi:MAG: hypothetical protein HC906_17920, partial [Bacteroidales bacterium]|nr:hypothetical protein [Bacteroidales bacterium]
MFKNLFYNTFTLFILLYSSADVFGIENGTTAVSDTFYAYKTSTTPTIDGMALEACWENAAWYPMSNVWLPYNDQVDSTDFYGRFKLAWDENRLYLLVEVTDDSLYDGHTDPLQNYWDDDCVELFLDEDQSGGNHQYNFNAFAYHVGIAFDVVDYATSGPATFNDHIQAARVKQGDKYTWELSVKVFDDSYEFEGENTPVELAHNKKMGFSLAYCDNDGSNSRENFIGSKYLPQSKSNNSYIDASIFGKLILKDTSVPSSQKTYDQLRNKVIMYPNPVSNN